MTSQALEWFRKLDDDPEYLAEEVKSAFAVGIERQMRRNAMSKADIARRLAKSPAYVTKVLRGDANLTINTLVAFAHAVDASLHLHVAERQTKVRWLEE